MCTNLQNRQGTYYFRRRVPKEIREHFVTASGKPRAEWRWSLGVKNREQAKRLLPTSIAKTNLWIDGAIAAGPICKSASTPRQVSSAVSLASQAIADEMELGSHEAAAFFAREQFIEECRAEADPTSALELEIRAERGLELRRLREKREDRELLAEVGKAQQASLMEMFEGYAGEAGARPATIDGFRSHTLHREIADHISMGAEVSGQAARLSGYSHVFEPRGMLALARRSRGKGLTTKR